MRKNNQLNWQITLVLESPLHIGDGQGNVLVDQQSNQPYIPATSLVGSFKSFLKAIGEETLSHTYLGNQEKQSQLFFTDMYVEKAHIETRQSVAMDSRYGVAVDGGLYKRQYIGAGATFICQIEAQLADEALEEARELINKFIVGLQDGGIRLGAQKTAGVGKLKVLKAEEQCFHLENLKELMAYLNGNNAYRPIPIEKLKTLQKSVIFELKATTKTPILIKGKATKDVTKSDHEPIKNSKDQYIIPGTSLKGVLRTQAKKIAGFLNEEDLVTYLFGNDREERKQLQMGKLYIEEVEIQNASLCKTNKIKIDRLTGGVVSKIGALMQEEAVKGTIYIRMQYSMKETNPTKEDQKNIAFIALLLRDLGTGKVALGSGSGVGRGLLVGEWLKISGILPQEEVIELTGEKLSRGSSIEVINNYVAQLGNE